MFGSRKEPRLFDGRKIVWQWEPTSGSPLIDVLASVAEFANQYPGDKSRLMIGYWEYGDAIVVTAPALGQ